MLAALELDLYDYATAYLAITSADASASQPSNIEETVFIDCLSLLCISYVICLRQTHLKILLSFEVTYATE